VAAESVADWNKRIVGDASTTPDQHAVIRRLHTESDAVTGTAAGGSYEDEATSAAHITNWLYELNLIHFFISFTTAQTRRQPCV